MMPQDKRYVSIVDSDDDGVFETLSITVGDQILFDENFDGLWDRSVISGGGDVVRTVRIGETWHRESKRDGQTFVTVDGVEYRVRRRERGVFELESTDAADAATPD
jgi:hypothetical protein